MVLRRRLRDLKASVHTAIDETERIRDEAFGQALQTAARTDARSRNRSHVHDSLDDLFNDSFDQLVERAVPSVRDADSRVETTHYSGPRDTRARDHTRREFHWL